MQYLSQEWIDAADGALAAAWSAPDAGTGPGDGPDHTTTIGFVVSGAPQGKVSYHVHFGPDGAGVAAGPPEEDPDATMALDYDTAVDVAQGESSAQVAFMQGRLKFGGDVTLLIRGADHLARVTDALGTLRDATEY